MYYHGNNLERLWTTKKYPSQSIQYNSRDFNQLPPENESRKQHRHASLSIVLLLFPTEYADSKTCLNKEDLLLFLGIHNTLKLIWRDKFHVGLLSKTLDKPGK